MLDTVIRIFEANEKYKIINLNLNTGQILQCHTMWTFKLVNIAYGYVTTCSPAAMECSALLAILLNLMLKYCANPLQEHFDCKSSQNESH